MRLLEFCGDGGGNGLHLLGWQGHLGTSKGHVLLALQGHEVDVAMGHFQTQHADTDALAGNGLLERQSNM